MAKDDRAKDGRAKDGRAKDGRPSSSPYRPSPYRAITCHVFGVNYIVLSALWYFSKMQFFYLNFR